MNLQPSKQQPTINQKPQINQSKLIYKQKPITKQKPLTNQSSFNLFSKLINILLLTLFILLLSIPLIYLLDSKRVHTLNSNLLYDVFENSTQHTELYKQISKSKYAIIKGQKQNGIFHFINHFANKQTLKQRKVILQHYHQPLSFVNQYIEQLKYYIEQILDLQDKFKNIWILTSKTAQNIPKNAILKIIHRHPKDKIFIVTTGNQTIPNFQLFTFPPITEHDVKQSIEKNFQMDQNTADILYDFYGTPEQALQQLDIGQYSQQQLLGENYKQLIDFSQQDVRILKDLCKKGEAKSQTISQELGQFGIIHFQGNNYWLNRHLMLNYQLHQKVKCVDEGVASEQILFQIQKRIKQGVIQKSEQQLKQEEVWNEDEIIKVEQVVNKKVKGKGKGKKSKKAK